MRLTPATAAKIQQPSTITMLMKNSKKVRKEEPNDTASAATTTESITGDDGLIIPEVYIKTPLAGHIVQSLVLKGEQSDHTKEMWQTIKNIVGYLSKDDDTNSSTSAKGQLFLTPVTTSQLAEEFVRAQRKTVTEAVQHAFVETKARHEDIANQVKTCYHVLLQCMDDSFGEKAMQKTVEVKKVENTKKFKELVESQEAEVAELIAENEREIRKMEDMIQEERVQHAETLRRLVLANLEGGRRLDFGG
mmetsp:Transcript_8848/g.13022  ORF Transcript_8848/g.13022 Transcript_8848/m.13022 type:complete len:248 (-) Transcript_8848:328-1071(-)